MKSEHSSLADRVRADAAVIRGDVERLVRHASIAFPGFPPEPVFAAAHEVVAVLTEAGASDVRLIDLPVGFPAVFAEVSGPPGSPTVLLYAHYDVQPAGDLSAWRTPPFEPTEIDGRLYGRGTADDKSGVAIHAAVIRAFAAAPPCTLRIVIEGEEEYGGNFEDYPRAHPELFDVDAIVVADVGNVRLGEPSLTTTLRGLVDAEIEIRTLVGPQHSGMFGGPAPDALMLLIRVLATLTDENGDCAIAGLTAYEWTGGAVDESEYRSVTGVLGDTPLVGSGSLATRIYSKPSVTVIGLDAPAVAGASNSLVPVARAKVSLRLAPGQDERAAMDALVAHLREAVPAGVEATVTPGMAGAPFACATGGSAFEAARRALRTAYGREPVEIGAGGSIPLVSVLHEVAPRAELLLMGSLDPMALIHAPNESLDLGELERAAVAETLLISELAALVGPTGSIDTKATDTP